MGREEVFIDAGLVVETFEEAGGDEAVEVLVAFLILTEKDEVVVAIGFGFILVILLGDVEFAADDGVDAFGLGGVVELDGSEEVAMVGHGDGGHLLFGDDVHHLGDFTGSVEEGVIGMAVEMDEGRVGHRGCARGAPGGGGDAFCVYYFMGAGVVVVRAFWGVGGVGGHEVSWGSFVWFCGGSVGLGISWRSGFWGVSSSGAGFSG